MKGTPKQKITPMFKQYFEIKEKYPDAILFFRLGDFFEMFFEDAETVAPLLGLVLTKREAGKGLTAPMCGVPVEKSNFYIQKLVKMGFKVAICEQVEDPATAKGLVKREVVRIITPGLVVDFESLVSKEKNYLAALYLGKKAGLAFLELSCGEFIFTEIGRDQFLSELIKREPREILIAKEQEEEEGLKELKQHLPLLRISLVDKSYFKIKEKLKEKREQGFEEGLRAVSAVLEYVKRHQPDALERIEEPEFYFPQGFLYLDENTKRNLELIRNRWDNTEKYSLYWVLDHTLTPMGGRLLKDWILYPLQDVAQIRERHKAISYLLEEQGLRERLKEILRKIGDLERLAIRCALRLANPKELALLRDSLKLIPGLKALLEERVKDPYAPQALKEVCQGIEVSESLYQRLEEVLEENPPHTLKEGGIVRKGVIPELDELRDLKENSVLYLSELEKREREKTGIPTLRIGYNKVFGYYFEVSKSYKDRVPEYFERKQTLTNVERFITPELKELETKILNAEERIKLLEYEFFVSLREEVAGYKAELKRCARAVAILDVLLSLAEVAEREGYVCPEFTEEPVLFIEEGRHPVLEKIQGRENFVPNSVKLTRDSERLLVITGPNMGGKSTYLRQTALIVIMAQMGSFVPAKSARLQVFDRIFTRIGAGDELVRGKSTFMVEMSECAHILKHATSRSLVVLDEVGRGTSTYDGLSLAWAIAEYLYERKVFTLLATHYFELTELAKLFEGIKNYHVAVKEWQGEVIFLYKVEEGATADSYGIEVARIAGLPEEVIARAKEILTKLEKQSFKKNSEIKTSDKKKIFQLPIFSSQHPLIEEIKRLKLEEMTPIEALNFLWKAKERLLS